MPQKTKDTSAMSPSQSPQLCTLKLYQIKLSHYSDICTPMFKKHLSQTVKTTYISTNGRMDTIIRLYAYIPENYSNLTREGILSFVLAHVKDTVIDFLK